MLNRFLNFQHKYRHLLLLAVALLTLLSYVASKKLVINADILELLPSNFSSIIAMDRISKVTGGLGSLIIVAEGKHPRQNRKFIEEFSRVASHEKSIQYVDFKKPVEFLKKNSVLWLPLSDVKQAESDVKALMEYYRIKATSLIPEALGPAPKLRLEKKLLELDTNIAQSEYYEASQGEFVISILKPRADSTDLAFSENLIKTMEDHAAKINKAYPLVTYSFTGLYKRKLDQFDIIQNDVKSSVYFTVSGILFSLFFFFRSFKAIVICIVPLLIGTMWNLGLNALILGHLNLVSSVFISVVMGLGIDQSIQIYSRMHEEYAKNGDYQKSLKISLLTSGKGNLFGTIATLSAFVILIFSDFLAFKETGITAAIGTVTVFLAISICLPVLVYILKPTILEASGESRHTKIAAFLHFLTFKHNKRVIVVALMLLGVAIAFIPKLHFEKDMDKLENHNLPATIKMKQVQKLFKSDITPSVAIVPTLSGLVEIKQQINRMARAKDSAIRDHRSIIDFMAYPKHEATSKLKSINRIRGIILKHLDLLPAAERVRIRKYLAYMPRNVAALNEYPQVIQSAFIGRENEENVYLYHIYPAYGIGQGEEAYKFAGELQQLKLPAGAIIGSDTILLKEIFALVTSEGAFIVPSAIILLFVVTWFLFRKVSAVIIVYTPLFFGILLLAGLFGFTRIFGEGLYLNFLNAVMIPVLLGMGIEYGVHYFLRYEEAKKAGADEHMVSLGLAETGMAMSNSAVTNMISFASLFLASYSGLKSIAYLAVFGMAFIFLSATVLIPAILNFRKRAA